MAPQKTMQRDEFTDDHQALLEKIIENEYEKDPNFRPRGGSFFKKHADAGELANFPTNLLNDKCKRYLKIRGRNYHFRTFGST